MKKGGSVAVPLVIVILLCLPLLIGGQALAWDGDGSGSGSRGSWTVRHFDEHRVPVDVNFEGSRENTTYHVSVPNTATITSASITLEGLQRYSLKGSPSDFNDTPTHKHHAYWGESGKYPPTTSPSHYNDFPFDPDPIDAIKDLDATVHTTTSPRNQGPKPFHYPYHLLDFVVNTTGMVRLGVEWHGWGYNSANDTVTHRAEVYLWNYTGTEWLRIGHYAANDTPGQVRTLARTFRDPSGLPDGHGHITLLVFGMHDEANAMGWPDVGEVATDYAAVTVLRNETLHTPRGVSLSIGDRSAFWSVSGTFTSTVTLGDAEGFKAALQAHVDSIPPAAEMVPVPFVFKMGASTWAEVRVQSLSVGVREVNNQPPQFLTATEVSMEEDVDLLRGLDLRDHFDDDYNGPDLTYGVVYEENASAVHAVIHQDGHHVDLLTVGDDWAGTLAFKFNATDVWGLTTKSEEFRVTVEEVNDAPRLEDPGDQYLDEDGPFELNLTAFDPDLPYGDSLAFEDDTDLFDVDPVTGRIAFTPLQAEVGHHDVTVTVRDDRDASHSVRFAVIITNVNDRPMIGDPGVLVAHEGLLFIHNFTISDEDGDTRFTWTLVGGIGTMNIGPINGRLSWIPEGVHVGTVNVSIIARDAQGAADQITVTIEVMNVNEPPVLDPLRRVQLTEGQRFTYTLTLVDPDLEVDPAEEHTFTVDPPLFVVHTGGVVNFTPTNEDVGVHHVNVTVTDAGGLHDTLPWELEVVNVNEPPTLDPVEDQVWREDHPAYLELTAYDPDVGDWLTFSDFTSMFDIDPRTGVINFTPIQSMVGKHQIRIRVQDSGGLYVDVYFDVTVASHDDPPVVSIRVVTLKDRLREGDMLSLAAEVEDEDDDREDLLYTWFLDGKELGNDDTIVLLDLGPGDHTVELRVDDSTSVISAFHEFNVEDVEEPFPWMTLVIAIIAIIVVAVLLLKVVAPVMTKLSSGPEGPKEPRGPGV